MVVLETLHTRAFFGLPNWRMLEKNRLINSSQSTNYSKAFLTRLLPGRIKTSKMPEFVSLLFSQRGNMSNHCSYLCNSFLSDHTQSTDTVLQNGHLTPKSPFLPEFPHPDSSLAVRSDPYTIKNPTINPSSLPFSLQIYKKRLKSLLL